ncbi:pantoate--beta-alanine ligase [Nereida sp. MMG024]|nr:pantoate--beta-alanine ligase [Nereida sp. MMG025]MCF6444151.1 pantoate--beta-alanine ligase [Nereida sp. MMG025]
MQTIRTVKDIRATVAQWKAQGLRVGLVPTMGFLHDGHMALVAAALKQADRVVTTIFVNPSQFGEAADLEAYPRDEARDLAMLEKAGVHAVFIPEVETIYPQGDETIVETTRMANMLHGVVRPGHFRGVTTVVARLFNIVGADVACFGEKDYQQLAIIKRMVADLHVPITIHGVPTVREADGLAMSSRNVRLSKEDRAAATVLSRSLKAAETANTVERIQHIIRETFASEPRADLIGLDIADAATLAPVTGVLSAPTAVMLSAQLGDVLLIDQRVFEP